MARGQAEEKEAEPEQAAPLAEEVPRLTHTEGAGATEAPPPAVQPKPAQQEGAGPAGEGGGLTEATPRLAPGEKKAAGPAIKLKKVISRKKAGKQDGPL